MAATPDASTGARPPIHLLDSESDLLGNLALRAEHRFPVVAAMLLTEIERAEIHNEETLPKDAITLGSEIDYLDEATGARRTVRLVLPAEADIEAGRISVMTPMGAGLIGLSTGQTIEWPDLEGRERRITIQAVRRPEKRS